MEPGVVDQNDRVGLLFEEVLVGHVQQAEELVDVEQHPAEPHHRQRHQRKEKRGARLLHPVPAKADELGLEEPPLERFNQIGSVQISARFTGRKENPHGVELTSLRWSKTWILPGRVESYQILKDATASGERRPLASIGEGWIQPSARTRSIQERCFVDKFGDVGEFQFLDPPIEPRARDPQQLGGSGLVLASTVERALDQASFDLGEQLVQRDRRGGTEGGR